MSATKLNRIILDKLENHPAPSEVKEFLREILQYERDRLDQLLHQYTSHYQQVLTKHVPEYVGIDAGEDADTC